MLTVSRISFDNCSIFDIELSMLIFLPTGSMLKLGFKNFSVLIKSKSCFIRLMSLVSNKFLTTQ